MSFNADALPGSDAISNRPLRDAAAALDAARRAYNLAGKDVVEAQQTIEQSQWADAKIEEAAIAEGKPAPKTRANTLAHEKRITDLEHAQRVAELACNRAGLSLDSAISAHGPAYAREADKLAADLAAKWATATAALSKLAGERDRAVRIARRLGSERPGVSAVPFGLRQLEGIEVPHGGPKTAFVAVEDILAGLSELGQQSVEVDTVETQGGAPTVGPLGPATDNAANSAQVRAFMAAATAERDRAQIA